MCTFEIRTDPTACCCTVQLLSTWLLDLEWTDFFTQIIPRIFFTFPRFIKVTMTTFDQYRLQYIPLMEQFHEINQSLILTPKMYENVQMFYCWLVQVYTYIQYFFMKLILSMGTLFSSILLKNNISSKQFARTT